MLDKIASQASVQGPRRVAIVHDWLEVYGGAERVIEEMLVLFPDADLHAVVDMLPEHLRHFIGHRPVKTSFIQRLPFARKHFRAYLPLMPIAIEQFDFSGYDLVISSSHAVAKGIITGPDQLHVCYCYSPIRYAWDMQAQYFTETGIDKGAKRLFASLIMHYMRLWDARTTFGVDDFIAISRFIARRVRKVYRRESRIIYPPVRVDDFELGERKEEFYLTASRHVPYKKIPLVVEAFNAMPDKRLVVVGDGPEFAKIKALAGPNVEVVGHQPDAVLKDYMKRAKAFVYAAEEDFGIVLLEAQASGTPVIAYGRGGALETVRDRVTGLLFHQQTPQGLREAVRAFEALPALMSPADCRRNALRFSAEVFRETFRTHLQSVWDRHARDMVEAAPARAVAAEIES